MGQINAIADLPWRRDLDQRVAISPDEAGRFDQLLVAKDTDPILKDEIDLILDTGLPTNAEVLESEYALAETDDSAYQAFVVGYPPNSEVLSKWTVTFFVKE